MLRPWNFVVGILGMAVAACLATLGGTAAGVLSQDMLEDFDVLPDVDPVLSVLPSGSQENTESRDLSCRVAQSFPSSVKDMNWPHESNVWSCFRGGQTGQLTLVKRKAQAGEYNIVMSVPITESADRLSRICSSIDKAQLMDIPNIKSRGGYMLDGRRVVRIEIRKFELEKRATLRETCSYVVEELKSFFRGDDCTMDQLEAKLSEPGWFVRSYILYDPVKEVWLYGEQQNDGSHQVLLELEPPTASCPSLDSLHQRKRDHPADWSSSGIPTKVMNHEDPASQEVDEDAEADLAMKAFCDALDPDGKARSALLQPATDDVLRDNETDSQRRPPASLEVLTPLMEGQIVSIPPWSANTLLQPPHQVSPQQATQQIAESQPLFELEQMVMNPPLPTMHFLEQLLYGEQQHDGDNQASPSGPSAEQNIHAILPTVAEERIIKQASNSAPGSPQLLPFGSSPQSQVSTHHAFTMPDA